MQPTRRAALAVLLACAVTTACAGTLQFRAVKTTLMITQAVSDLQLGELALYEAQTTVEGVLVTITPEQHERIQGYFLRMGIALELAGTHLRNGEGQSASAAVNEILNLLDDLVRNEVIQLDPGHQAILAASVATIRSVGALLVDLLPDVTEPVEVEAYLGHPEPILARAEAAMAAVAN